MEHGRYPLRRLLIVALSLSCLLALGWFPVLSRPQVAFAHAFVIGSDPVDGSTVANSPAVVRIFFNAYIGSASIAHVYLFTTGSTLSEGQLVDATSSTVSPTNPRELDIPLLMPGRLPQGSYAVRWTALATDDGHATSGLIGFNVGHTATGLSGTPLVGPSTSNYLPQMNLQGILEVMWEWLTLLVLTGWAGMLVTEALVTGTGEGERIRKQGIPLQWLYPVALLIGEGLNLALRATLLTQALHNNGIYLAAIRQLVLETSYGHLWLVRLGLICITLGYVWWTTHKQHRRARLWPPQLRAIVLLLLIGLILLSRTFSGDVVQSAQQHISAVVFEWLFLAAEGVWFGGAIYLGFVLIPLLPVIEPDYHGQTLVMVLRRYTPLLLAAIGVLLVSGLFLSEASIPGGQQLLTSPYGRALQVKILLIALMLLVSGYNLFMLRPELTRRVVSLPVGNAELPAQRRGHSALEQTTSNLKGALRFLSLLGAGVLLCAAFMSFYAPPIVSPRINAAQAGSTSTDSQNIQAKQVGNLSIRLVVLPARLNTANTVIVSLIESNGDPVTDAQVQITTNMVAMDMGTARKTIRSSNSTYMVVFGKGEAFNMYGDWTIDISIQRPQQSVHVAFVETLTG